MFGMYFSSPVLRSRRRVRHYDLNNIVAAVGGSLGLCLGFSCLSFGRGAVEWALRTS